MLPAAAQGRAVQVRAPDRAPVPACDSGVNARARADHGQQEAGASSATAWEKTAPLNQAVHNMHELMQKGRTPSGFSLFCCCPRSFFLWPATGALRRKSGSPRSAPPRPSLPGHSPGRLTVRHHPGAPSGQAGRHPDGTSGRQGRISRQACSPPAGQRWPRPDARPAFPGDRASA